MTESYSISIIYILRNRITKQAPRRGCDLVTSSPPHQYHNLHQTIDTGYLPPIHQMMTTQNHYLLHLGLSRRGIRYNKCLTGIYVLTLVWLHPKEIISLSELPILARTLMPTIILKKVYQMHDLWS